MTAALLQCAAGVADRLSILAHLRRGFCAQSYEKRPAGIPLSEAAKELALPKGSQKSEYETSYGSFSGFLSLKEVSSQGAAEEMTGR
jgi:hypothetical protein